MNNERILLNLLKSNKFILFEYLKLNYLRYNVNSEENNIRMDSINSDNYNGLSLNLNTMMFYDFKTLEKGNVISLLSKITGKNRNIVHYELYNIINNNEQDMIKGEEISFEYERKELLIYPKQLLNLYPLTISDLFLEDGINESSQCIFDIRYDKESDRVLIPVMFKDNLVGIIGRYNNKNVPKNVPKYYPILSYPKSEVLFGYDINKDRVKETKTVILVESEKSVIKAYQSGINTVLAIGGSNISNSQIELLKELGVKNIFLCFDSDKELKLIEKQAKNKWFIESTFSVNIIKNNESIPEKSCLFDLDLSREKIIKYIKRFSIKI